MFPPMESTVDKLERETGVKIQGPQHVQATTSPWDKISSFQKRLRLKKKAKRKIVKASRRANRKK